MAREQGAPFFQLNLVPKHSVKGFKNLRIHYLLASSAPCLEVEGVFYEHDQGFLEQDREDSFLRKNQS